jgi:hypothetical protein
VLEVVDDAFTVEKVHGGAEEVPVERLGEAQTAGLAGHICNGNDLLEGYDLHRGDDDDDVDVAGAENPEEAEDHDERPYGAGYEVCLFLLVLGGGQLWSLRLSAGCCAWQKGLPVRQELQRRSWSGCRARTHSRCTRICSLTAGVGGRCWRCGAGG